MSSYILQKTMDVITYAYVCWSAQKVSKVNYREISLYVFLFCFVLFCFAFQILIFIDSGVMDK